MAIIDNLRKVSDTVWELPVTYKDGMRVPARVIATEKLVREMDEAVYQQISNVATLPGITRSALCMPDGNTGSAFPIGGVRAWGRWGGPKEASVSLAALGSISTAACAWLSPISRTTMCSLICIRSLTSF